MKAGSFNREGSSKIKYLVVEVFVSKGRLGERLDLDLVAFVHCFFSDTLNVDKTCFWSHYFLELNNRVELILAQILSNEAGHG